MGVQHIYSTDRVVGKKSTVVQCAQKHERKRNLHSMKQKREACIWQLLPAREERAVDRVCSCLQLSMVEGFRVQLEKTLV